MFNGDLDGNSYARVGCAYATRRHVPIKALAILQPPPVSIVGVPIYSKTADKMEYEFVAAQGTLATR